MAFFRRLLRRLLALPRWYLVGGGAVVVVGILALHHFTATSSDSSAPQQISHVSLASVADLSSQVGSLTVVGTITSVNQATILAQTSGEVVSLRHALGDRVVAGEVIGEFENSSEQAAVTQAEGSYESAQAALAQAQGTTASNSSISSSQASSAAQNAATSLSAALASTYAALDDAVHTKADSFLVNPNSTTPVMQSFTIPDSQLVINIQNERVALRQVFVQASAAASGSGDLDANAKTLLSSAQITLAFLNDFITALNEAIPNATFSSSALAADQATIAAARSEVNAAISTLTSAKSGYDSALSGAQTAANSASSGTQNSIAVAQAQLKTAQGALEAAQANLQKTIIRSPISGTLVSLPITQGTYVSSFAQVAMVSNPGALYADAHITKDDAQTLTAGGRAIINGSTRGVITFIAPAIDPTNGKIEIKVGITGDQSALTDGEAVNVSLQRSGVSSQATSSALTIPIVAANITPAGPVVFTVSASSTLVAHPVVLGAIEGDQVGIASGITPDMQLVIDARGLSQGQQVVVDTATSTPQ